MDMNVVQSHYLQDEPAEHEKWNVIVT